MFDRIGGKIKALASVVCWIGIIIYAIVGLVLMFTTSFFSGLLTIVLGGLVAWIGSFLLYGFGQLIENTDILVARSRSNDE